MLYAAAAEQLSLLREEQEAFRGTVEQHMTDFHHAKAARDDAVREEEALRAQLHAAQLRSAQRQRAFAAAEAVLRESAESLAALQALCHCLESQLAAQRKCQRSALILRTSKADHEVSFDGREGESGADVSAADEAKSGAPQLCWMDPYSALHPATGSVFTYDLVAQTNTVEACLSEGTDSGARRPDEQTADDDRLDDENSDPHPSLNALLVDAVHDVLNGYNYTFLSTSASGRTAAAADNNSAEMKTSQGSTTTSTRNTVHSAELDTAEGRCGAGVLCWHVVRCLQQEAMKCGTRAFGVTLAIGCVVRAASNGAEGYLADVLGPKVRKQNVAAAAAHRGNEKKHLVPLVVMDAALHDDVAVHEHKLPAYCQRNGSDRRSRSSSEVRFRSLDPNRSPLSSADKARGVSSVPPSAPSTLLTGVPVSSLEEVEYWLGQARLHVRDASTTTKGSRRTEVDAQVNGAAAAAVDLDISEAASPYVVLLGVDSQDAAGRVHKSLVRIVDDNAFKLAASMLSVTAVHECTPSPHDPLSAHYCAAQERRIEDLHPTTPSSLFATYMHTALSLVLQKVASFSASSSSSSASSGSLFLAESSDVLDCENLVAQLLLSEDNTSAVSAAAVRAAVAQAAACPAALHSDMCAEWSLWNALLMSIFGGNTKTLWLHTADVFSDEVLLRHRRETKSASAYSEGQQRGGGSARAHGEEEETEGSGSGGGVKATHSSVEGVLRMCAFFCRAVRHDAVPCEVSADLDRILRHNV
uniref:Uncharacterized protein n=1 Tax=Angomonas deanei TaxID=59799 RepID=C6K3R1_9TRYP|nr:conserved hypothetical protein [Angomonas deanei]